VSSEFLARVAGIVIVDLLLAGDNAVIIAMAVKPLPAAQRRKGILLGAGAAVLLRVVLTFFVAQLLRVPFVKLGGGLLILWIAIKLLAGEAEASGGGQRRDAASLGDAVRLIVLADVSMSLDNMLAVGGLSHGDPLLLGIGLGVSIPFVVFTSDLLSRLMDRYSWIVYVGAAILGKVGAEMILTDPLTERYLHPSSLVIHVVEAVFAIAVILVGRLRARSVQRARGEPA
jgi:YjbE family integral membrane protein